MTARCALYGCPENFGDVAQRPSIPIPRETWRNFGETRGAVGKSGVMEHKSGNISETRIEKSYYGGPIYEVTNALLNGTNADPLRPPLPQHFKRYYLRNV